MDACAVGHALVLEVEHFFPDAIAVVAKGFVEAFLLEDASLHFVEHFLFWHAFSLVLELVEVLLSFWKLRVAFARQGVDELFKVFVEEVVDLDILQEHHEGLPEVAVYVLLVDEGL